MIKEETFKIQREKLKKYTEGELCVMLILVDGAYMVEVVNKAVSLGRIILEKRKEAEFLFLAIENLFCRYRIIENAEAALTKAFAFGNYDLIAFAIYATNRILTNDNLVYLRKNIFIRFTTELNKDYKLDKKDMVTIYISKDFKTEPIGFLVGTNNLKNLKFRLL